MLDWRRLSRDAGFKVSGDELVVTFTDGRQHRVAVEERPDRKELRLSAVAARPSMLPADAEGPHVAAWKRNRFSDLVGFQDRQPRPFGGGSLGPRRRPRRRRVGTLRRHRRPDLRSG